VSPTRQDPAPLSNRTDWPREHAAYETPDPELLLLPAPPRGRRLLSMALLATVIAAALGLLIQLRIDAAYALTKDSPSDIGEATLAQLERLQTNRYVRVHGTPMLSHAVRYEHALSGRGYAIFPLAGQRQILVQIPLEALRDPARVARGEFTGRLVTFGQLGGRMRAIRFYLVDALQMPVTAESFVLLAEEAPATYDWALFSGAGCLAMMAAAAWLLWRWFHRLRPSPDPA
jgi:hypothetical protein